MAVSRADTLTGSKRNQEYFSDFLDSFAKTPVGNQLARITNERSINQSLKNLIMTNMGERLYQPFIGSNVYASLFELNTPALVSGLEFYIETTIKNNEPRIHLMNVKVSSLSKANFSGNEILIEIVYYLINNSDPITTSFILKRVR